MSNLASVHSAATATTAPRPAISAWPDVDNLYRRFAELVKQPMRPIRADKMPQVMRYFDERCQGSKRLSERAKAGQLRALAEVYATSDAQGKFVQDFVVQVDRDAGLALGWARAACGRWCRALACAASGCAIWAGPCRDPKP